MGKPIVKIVKYFFTVLINIKMWMPTFFAIYSTNINFQLICLFDKTRYFD